MSYLESKSISTNLVDVYVYKFMLGVRCVGLWAVGCLCVNKLLLFTDIARLHPLPYPLTLTASPAPGEGVTHNFFHQNDHKGC